MMGSLGRRISQKAGRRTQASSLLPCWGGAKIISRQMRPLTTWSRVVGHESSAPARPVAREGVAGEFPEARP